MTPRKYTNREKQATFYFLLVTVMMKTCSIHCDKKDVEMYWTTNCRFETRTYLGREYYPSTVLYSLPVPIATLYSLCTVGFIQTSNFSQIFTFVSFF